MTQNGHYLPELTGLKLLGIARIVFFLRSVANGVVVTDNIVRGRTHAARGNGVSSELPIGDRRKEEDYSSNSQ